MEHGEEQLPVLRVSHLHLVHGVDDVMSAKFVDLLAIVRRANGDDRASGGDGGFDATRRVFENDRALWVDA